MLPVVAEYLEEESKPYTLVFEPETPEAWAERVLLDFGVSPKYTKAAFLRQLEIAIEAGLADYAKPETRPESMPNPDVQVPIWKI